MPQRTSPGALARPVRCPLTRAALESPQFGRNGPQSARHARALAGSVHGRHGLGVSKETDLAQWYLIILERIKRFSSLQCVLVEGTCVPAPTDGSGNE